MAAPAFSMTDLIEAGVHFGHKTRRWNPKMAPYIFGERNDVHIIDLQQTVPLLHQALNVVRNVVANNGRVLFVGTKRQATEIVSEAAVRCGQYYVNERWLGGMLTNWSTIQNSIRKLRRLEEQAEHQETSTLTKKERLNMERERQKLEKSLGGIKNMAGLPDVIFLIDTNREDLAIKEANKLGIPVIAILDSNSSPEGITYPIPGNDDATKAIRLYSNLIANAVLDGLQSSVARKHTDTGASAELPTAETTAEDNAADGELEVVVKKTPKRKASSEAKEDEASSEEKKSEKKAS